MHQTFHGTWLQVLKLPPLLTSVVWLSNWSEIPYPVFWILFEMCLSTHYKKTSSGYIPRNVKLLLIVLTEIRACSKMALYPFIWMFHITGDSRVIAIFVVLDAIHEGQFSVSYVPHFDWLISVDMTIKMTDCELEVSRQYLCLFGNFCCCFGCLLIYLF